MSDQLKGTPEPDFLPWQKERKCEGVNDGCNRHESADIYCPTIKKNLCYHCAKRFGCYDSEYEQPHIRYTAALEPK